MAKKIRKTKTTTPKRKFEIAPQDEIDSHPDKRDRLLKALGHPEALVTDESSIWDFFPLEKPDSLKRKLKVLARKLEVEMVDTKDYLIEVIRRMPD